MTDRPPQSAANSRAHARTPPARHGAQSATSAATGAAGAGHTDAADIATEYAAYTDTMNSKPRRSTPTRGSSTGSGAGAAWAIIAAAVLALLTLCSR